ncbi:MAG: glycosyltransferase [bacterium]
MVKIIVQIPAYNEEEKIVGVIKNIPRNIDGNPVEVLVIDDYSSDNTVKVAQEA